MSDRHINRHANTIRLLAPWPVETETTRMNRTILKPLALFNLAFVLMLVTLGPRYGWAVMIIIGALVTALNLFVIRSLSKPPRP